MVAGEGVEPSASESKSDVLPVTLSCNLVAAEGVEPSSLDYRSSALPIVLHRDGRSDRAQTCTSRLKRPLLCHSSSGSKRLAVAEGLEPSMAGLTIRCLTNLATPQKIWLRRRESNSYQLVYKTSALNPIELRRKILVDREGLKPSQEVCRTSMLSLHHQPEIFGGCGWSRTTNLALMRRLLCPLSYTAEIFGSPRRS